MSETLDLLEPAGDGLEPLVAPPPYESVKWKVRVGDQEYGPYPRTRIIQFLKEGRIKAHTLLCCGSDKDFIAAEKHPNLRWDFSGPRKRRFGEPKLEPGETEPPICNYFIAGRLVSSSDAFERALRSVGKFTLVAGDMWVLRSRMTVQQIRNRLAAAAKPHEQFVIVNATRDRLAWCNLGLEQDIALRDVWDAEDVS
jgi:hypothetical protein